MLRFFHKPNELNRLNNNLNAIIDNHFYEYFKKYPRLKVFSRASKKAIKLDIKNKIIEILKSDNQLLELRKIISEYVLKLAYFTVLSMTEDDKKGLFSNNIYISASLYKILIKILPYEDELKVLSNNHLITNEEIHEYCHTRKILFSFYVNGLNYVRLSIGDIIEEDDWLNPFYEAMCVWQEDIIRKNSNIPTLLERQLPSLSLAYSSFWNIVESGEKDPLKIWKIEMEEIVN